MESMLKDKTRKFYIVFWVFFAVFLMVTAMQWATIFYLEQIKDSLNPDLNLRLFYFYGILWPCLVLGEWIVYWMIRKRISELRWIWYHLILLVLTFLILPLVVVIITIFIRGNYGATDSYDFTMVVYRVRFYSFWTFIILAHIFFIIALVKAFSKPAESDHDQDSGFLDQFS